jgi:predicted enzyme related to lactoylglutathione lyase
MVRTDQFLTSRRVQLAMLAVRYATASGGSVMKDKFSIGQYGFISLVNYTKANVIALHSMK